jgi:5S rRNA maturation endonuclease (ribonuclease M5)
MIDFIRLLNDNNIPYINEVENWTNLQCPYHDNGKRGFKAGFNHSGQYIYCWVCGSHRIEKFVSDLLSISFYEAKKFLQEYDTESRIIKKISKRAKGKEIILPGWPIEKNSKAYKYLLSRNFDPEYLIDTYKIQDGGLTGYWSFRIIIPIIINNRIISYQGRSIFSKEKCLELGIERYQTLEIEKSIVNAKHTFYGIDECKNDWVVLVEGPFDRWRLGPNNVLSSLGTSTSEQQIILLAERYKKVIFLFDNEKEAQLRAKKYGERLAGLGVDVEIFNPEFEHDPGDYNLEEENFVRQELGLLLNKF